MTEINRLTCEEALRRLDDYLDRELNAEEMAQVRAHLEVCAACAREFEFEGNALRAVRIKLRQIEMPAEARARLASALERERGD